MSFQSARNHANNHHFWYNTNDYPAYIVESMPSMVTAPPRHQKAHVRFNDEYEERVEDAPTRVRVIEYEYKNPPPRVNSDRYEIYEEKVDKEAEAFIKLEHRKFGY